MPRYTCSKCSQLVSENAPGLIWHLKNRHALLVGRMFTCPITCGQNGCMRTFRYSAALVKHIETQHGGDMIDGDDNGDPIDNNNEGLDFIPDLVPDVPVQDQLPEQAQDVTKSAAIFLAKMKASSSTVQSTVDQVVSETSNLFSDVIGTLKAKTEQFLQSQNIDEDDIGRQNLLREFDQLQNPFEQLETAHQQQKYFIQSGNYVKPREIPLGIAYYPHNNRDTGHVDQVAKHITFQYVPVPDLLKCVLESKGFMREILLYHPSNDGVMRDFHDGLFCKEHDFFANQKNIRLLLYVDECEIANPLGSKAGLHKIGVIYCTILNIPPRFRSSLSNCFLVSLYNAADVKTYGYAPILQPAVDDIKLLEREGLRIVSDVFEGTVRVSIAQLTGDNLGVNGILGFVESFVSNCYCRHCKMHRNEMHTCSVERPDQLRNVDNYEEDLQLNNPSATGVKVPCLLNDADNFHITSNYAPDIMHDLLEGVCGLEVHLVLGNLIGEGLFDLDLVNSRITSFDYATTDSRNKPSSIPFRKLQTPDGASGQTASQMWCLIRYLPLLIGDKVPEGHQQFELLLLLLECMDFIFSPEVTTGETFFLKHLIKDHHDYFLELYPDRHLKPKHHFMTHYPRQMRLLGPLLHYWTMRFEAKHRFFKRLGHIVCNYRNILKTLCSRQQMYLCYNIMSGKDLVERDVEIGPGSLELVASLEGAEFLSRTLEIHLFQEVYVAKWCIIHGIKYCKNLLVITGKSDDVMPIFQQIVYVIVTESNAVKLITKKWDTVRYDRHTHTYVIRQLGATSWSMVSVDNLYDYYPCHASKSYNEGDQHGYVVLRHRIH